MAKTEGPYFVDNMPPRSDIRPDSTTGKVETGVTLRLDLTVLQVTGNTCSPLVGAKVDIWHANSTGIYSDISSEGSSGLNYLRGNQVTNASGKVEFATVYPGWYSGRTIHIHFKDRGSNINFTSQLFFNDMTTDQVMAQSPYNTRGLPDTPDSADSIYDNTLLLNLTVDGSGYVGTYTIVVS